VRHGRPEPGPEPEPGPGPEPGRLLDHAGTLSVMRIPDPGPMLAATRRTVAPNRVPPTRVATAWASAKRSTSWRRGSDTQRSPNALKRSAWRAQVSVALIGTPRNAPGSGPRRPAAHQPPSVAGPSTAPTPGTSSAPT